MQKCSCKNESKLQAPCAWGRLLPLLQKLTLTEGRRFCLCPSEQMSRLTSRFVGGLGRGSAEHCPHLHPSVVPESHALLLHPPDVYSEFLQGAKRLGWRMHCEKVFCALSGAECEGVIARPEPAAPYISAAQGRLLMCATAKQDAKLLGKKKEQKNSTQK